MPAVTLLLLVLAPGSSNPAAKRVHGLAAVDGLVEICFGQVKDMGACHKGILGAVRVTCLK